jgi:hypothetical protein
MDTSDQLTFIWIPIRYTRGCSDQNEVSCEVRTESVVVHIRRERDQIRMRAVVNQN